MSYPIFGYYNPTHAQAIAGIPLAHSAPISAPTPSTTPSQSPSHHTPLDLSYARFTHPTINNQPLQAQQALAAQRMVRNIQHPLPFPDQVFPDIPPSHHPAFYTSYIPTSNDVIPLSAVSTVPSPVDSVSTTSESSSFTPDRLPSGTGVNWSPTLLIPTDPNISHPTTTTTTTTTTEEISFKQSKIHPPPNGSKPSTVKLLSRSRRAAASKARSNINKYTSALQSPIATPSISTSTTSRPSSRGSSYAQSGTSSVSQHESGRPMHHAHAPAPGGGNSSITIILPDPAVPKYAKKPSASASGGGTAVRLTGCRPDGQLLPAPPGSLLEVNDLLILHPPAASPGKGGKAPINQYSQAPCPEGYKSAFEMYTCRVCAKTYDGKNARSVARRHLQDKHNVPLALQERRTRWDGDVDRPKNEAEVKERTLRSKRDWAARARQHIRLERLHWEFLENYGQKGICTPCKTHLIAPALRVTTVSCVENPLVAKHHLEWREIPKSLRDAVADMNGNPRPVVAPEDEVYDHTYLPGTNNDDMPRAKTDKVPELPAKSRMGLRKKALTKRRVKSASFNSASVVSSSTQSAVSESLPISPVQMFRSLSGFGSTQSPVSHTRATSTGQIGLSISHAELELMSDWESTWGAATHVDETTLQIALAQHYQGAVNVPEPLAIDDAPIPRLQNHGQSEERIESPEPLYPISAPQWTQDPQAWSLPQGFTFSSTETPSAWTTSPDEMSRLRIDEEVDEEGGHEAAVAESLLNLHSTPAKPDDAIHLARLTHTTEVPASSDLPTGTASSAIRGLLDAPEITPRPPRPERARSFVQPFNKGRESVTRSLSFTENHPDDPFAFTPSSPVLSLKKKRRATVASPSPLAVKKRKNDSPMRLPMSILRPNAPVSTQFTANTPQIFHTGSSFVPANLTSSAYTTPVRPTKMTGLPGSAMPSSLSKVWQFSSPGDPGAAASLGLVPQWGMGTPGMSGMVGSETPNLRR